MPNEDVEGPATSSQSEGRPRLERGCLYYHVGDDDKKGKDQEVSLGNFNINTWSRVGILQQSLKGDKWDWRTVRQTGFQESQERRVSQG